MNVTYRPLESWQREETRSRRHGSAFKVGWSKMLDMLAKEMRMIEARDIVVEMDLEASDIRNDGLPRSTARPRTPRVKVSFQSKHGPLCYYCDEFDHYQANVYAISLTLQRLRMAELYGCTKRGEQYKGWAQLPGPSANGNGFSNAEEAWEWMQERCGWMRRDIRFALEAFPLQYRVAAKKLHPDTGGNKEDFQRLQEAKEVIEKRIGNP